MSQGAVFRLILGAALRFPLGAGIALIGACAQQPANPQAARHAEAIEANRGAEARLRAGDFEGAALRYREALRIAQSIEDVEAIAANAINLSIAYQRQGKHREARASLAPLLEQPSLNFPPARLAQAALRRAVLDFDLQRHADASEWLDRSAGWCGPQGCAVSAAIDNLRGMVALEQGRADAAAASASAALRRSIATGDRLEAANALRLSGNAAIHAGDAGAALTALAEALAIDRELALPRKIHLDLVGLGRASALGGDMTAAHRYYRRALSISEADRDAAGSAQARSLIRALGHSSD